MLSITSQDTTQTRPISQKKRMRYAILSVGLGVFLSIASAEVLLRVNEKLRPQFRGRERLDLFQKRSSGPKYGLKPNLDITTTVGEKKVRIRTNSFGMASREVSLQKTRTTKRIAFVGDSQTFGCWADRMEDSFVGVFDSLISPKGFEVLNFGTAGYGLGEMEVQIEEEVIKFDPDYVVLMVFNGNDFKDTYLGTDRFDLETFEIDRQNLDRKVPERFRPKKDLKDSPKDTTLRQFLSDHTAIYRFLSRLKKQMLPKERGRKGQQDVVDFEPSQIFGSYEFWSQVPYPEIALQARDLSLDTIRRINDFCRKKNIKLIIASIPYQKQVYARIENSAHFDINLPQRFVEDLAFEDSIPYFDLLPSLRAYVKETKKRIYVENDTHFNNQGHFIIGNNLAEWFVEIGLPK